jgi:GR25 family glycosyltransferase involved in LPS biosynthesis
MRLNTDKIFIIHYTPLKKRKEKMDSQMSTLDNEHFYIEEFDKENLSSELISGYYDTRQEAHDNKIAPLWDPNIHTYRRLNNAELSCTIKHIEAIGKVGRECPNHGLILEDDALLEDNFAESFNFFLSKTPKDWDVILMGAGCGEWFINHKLEGEQPVFTSDSLGSPSIFKAPHPATNCAEAYLIKPQAATQVYQGAVPFNLVSDWEMAYQFYKLDLNVYWWTPPLVTQGSKDGTYYSTLDEGQRR